jgi:hypothetical protein
MALSFIKSGCLAISLNDRTVFVLKGLHDEIESIKKADDIQFGLECIKRPEFPSVRMYFNLRDESNKSHSFDYFFNMDSNEEIKLLRRFKEQDYFDIFFTDSKTVHSKRITLTKEDKDKIKAVLDET